MKSLGKQKVDTLHFVDGKLYSAGYETRTVYFSPKQGRYFINHLNQKQEVINTGNRFVWSRNCSCVKSTSVNDVLARIKAKSKTGKFSTKALF